MSTGFVSTCAPALARENGDYSQSSAFFDAIGQDPVMAGLKLIAEPWDLGPYGYQLGNFPPAGPSGTGNIGTRSGGFGRATEGSSPISPHAWRALPNLRIPRTAALGEHQFRHRP